MPNVMRRSHYLRWAGGLKTIVFGLALLFGSSRGVAQDTPLLSGGVGFFTHTSGGSTSYLPIIESLLAAPIGQHFLVESRAAFLESFNPRETANPGTTIRTLSG